MVLCDDLDGGVEREVQEGDAAAVAAKSLQLCLTL